MAHDRQVQRDRAGLTAQRRLRGEQDDLIQAARAGTLGPASLLALQRVAGNEAVARLVTPRPTVPTGPLQIQRALGDDIRRLRRRAARWLFNKSLPGELFRLDARAPATIATGGFAPWNAGGNISLKEHVTGALDVPDAAGATLAKPHSQWVSTGAEAMLMDPVVLTIGGGKTLYRIDSSAAGPGFVDANAHFDEIGKKHPFRKQREWTKDGTIPGSAVTGYLDFLTEVLPQLDIDMTRTVPVKLPAGGLTGWNPMPVVPGAGGGP